MEKTFFLLERFYRSTGIPTGYLSTDRSITLLRLGLASEIDPIAGAESRAELLQACEDGTPHLQFEENTVVLCSFLDSVEHWVVLGPVSLMPAQQGGGAGLPYVDLERFCSAVTLLFFQMTGRMLSETELVLLSADAAKLQTSQDKKLLPYQLEHAENEFHRFSYADEQKLMDRITRGDVDAIKKTISMADRALVETAVGKLADQPLKNMEYMFCSAIALATRAAIRGGLNENTAYSIADVLLQELSRCKTENEMIRVQLEAMHSFAAHVKDARERSSGLSYVELAKRYMEEHINKTLSLDAMAAEVGLNKSYLCRIFREAEGVTILHYFQDLQIEAAKNMLRYSRQDLSSIASYLGFASQSKFNAVFKNFAGTTPKKYRDQLDE